MNIKKKRSLTSNYFFLFVIYCIIIINATSLPSSHFPHNLLNKFLRSQSTEKQLSAPLFHQLAQDLYRCLPYNERCAEYLGSFLFQGLFSPLQYKASKIGWSKSAFVNKYLNFFSKTTSKTDYEYDNDASKYWEEHKNLTKALSLWKYGASAGSLESQYYLGLVYSSYFNPPSFLYSPFTILDHLNKFKTQHGNNLEEQQLYEGDKNQTYNIPTIQSTPRVESINLTPYNLTLALNDIIDPLEVDRFHLTAQILGLDFHGEQTEHLMVCAWEHHQTTLLKPFIVTPFDKVLNNSRNERQQSMEDNNNCASATIPTPNAPYKKKYQRMPLLRRDSLAVLYYYAAANGGHVEANLALGFRYLTGLNVHQRCQTAASYYMQVARNIAEFSTQGIPPASESIRLSLLRLVTTAGSADERLASLSIRSQYSTLQLHVAKSGDPAMQLAVGKKLLFGLDGFEQDYEKAADYFSLAARHDKKEALSYLGYLSALGLGLERNLNAAFQLFAHGALAPNDVLSHNGLGYIYFHGTDKISPNISKAVYHFNISASRGFHDAQFNLASLHIAGLGVEQSFGKAIILLAQALEQGHSAATYLLGVLHLNGFGTIRDCQIATTLFKKVAESHPKITKQLRRAFQLYQHDRLDEAAFIYWRLAEAGIEIAQSNLAFLLDGGGIHPVVPRNSMKLFSGTWVHILRKLLSKLPAIRPSFYSPSALFSLTADLNIGMNRAFAQRYWQLASIQGSAEANVQLGDYAYYGWGTEPSWELKKNKMELAEVSSQDAEAFGISHHRFERKDTDFMDSKGESMTGWASLDNDRQSSVHVTRRSPDYSTAYAMYEKAVYSPATFPNWVLRQQIRAQHNLARMHQSGRGVDQDFHIARRYLQKITTIDTPEIPAISARLSILILQLHAVFVYIAQRSVYEILTEDLHILCIAISISLIFATLTIRYGLKKLAHQTHAHAD